MTCHKIEEPERKEAIELGRLCLEDIHNIEIELLNKTRQLNSESKISQIEKVEQGLRLIKESRKKLEAVLSDANILFSKEGEPYEYLSMTILTAVLYVFEIFDNNTKRLDEYLATIKMEKSNEAKQG